MIVMYVHHCLNPDCRWKWQGSFRAPHCYHCHRDDLLVWEAK